MISKIESQNKKLFLISIFSLIIFVIAQILLFTTLTSSSLRQFEKITEIGANLEKTTSFPLNIGLIATVAVFLISCIDTMNYHVSSKNKFDSEIV